MNFHLNIVSRLLSAIISVITLPSALDLPFVPFFLNTSSSELLSFRRDIESPLLHNDAVFVDDFLQFTVALFQVTILLPVDLAG